jgi:glutaredoxin-like protein NrdH
MRVTIYSKPSCVQCNATIREMKAKGIDYEVIDLTQDDAAMTTVTKLGYRQVPVVVTDGNHWSGFRPDMIARLAS